jgi:hypothetical protein
MPYDEIKARLAFACRSDNDPVAHSNKLHEKLATSAGIFNGKKAEI